MIDLNNIFAAAFTAALNQAVEEQCAAAVKALTERVAKLEEELTSLKGEQQIAALAQTVASIDAGKVLGPADVLDAVFEQANPENPDVEQRDKAAKAIESLVAFGMKQSDTLGMLAFAVEKGTNEALTESLSNFVSSRLQDQIDEVIDDSDRFSERVSSVINRGSFDVSFSRY